MKLDQSVQEFIANVKKMENGEKLDLSSDEDLSIAVMNLISIEEHLFFSGGKTSQTHYYDLIDQVRNIRKQLLQKLIKKYEGEVWCISKHLLASSMRLMEVATKALAKREKDQAYQFFQNAYDLYMMFWGLNLGMIKKDHLQKTAFEKIDRPIVPKKNNLLGKISIVIGKILDCCRE